MTTNWNPAYIGDAVYASFDGYGIELRLNSHDAERVVYLEPEVMGNLEVFWARCQKERKHHED